MLVAIADLDMDGTLVLLPGYPVHPDRNHHLYTVLTGVSSPPGTEFFLVAVVEIYADLYARISKNKVSDVPKTLKDICINLRRIHRVRRQYFFRNNAIFKLNLTSNNLSDSL
jgi:hypothetical protein